MNLNKGWVTSDVRLGILGDGFEGRDDSIDDILHIQVGNDLLQLIVGDASYLRLDVVYVLYIVAKKRFEILLAHGLRQLLHLRDQFIAYSPGELVGDDVEVGLQGRWGFHLRQLDYRIDQIYFIRLLLVLREHLDYLQDMGFGRANPPHQIFAVLRGVFATEGRAAFGEGGVVLHQFLLVGLREVA